MRYTPKYTMPATQKQKNWAIRILRKKAEELGRAPKKSDFNGPLLAKIKTFLGPWPRALEAAGLKEPKKTETE